MLFASWKNTKEIGFSLLAAAEFDTKDSITLECEMELYAHTAGPIGRGPSLADRKERYGRREIAAASQMGQDLLDNSILLPPPTERLERPAKKSRRERDDKRMQAEQIRKAEEQAAVFKVRSSTHESATKRCYKVSNSSVGKAQYEVVISSACSCSCPYAQKFAGRISCKHVVFVWVSVLKGKTEDLAGFIPDETLRQVFSQSTSVPAELLLEKRSRRTRAELRKLLEESPFFKDDQVWAVGPKMGRPAKCFGCRDKLEVETKCVTIEGL